MGVARGAGGTAAPPPIEAGIGRPLLPSHTWTDRTAARPRLGQRDRTHGTNEPMMGGARPPRVATPAAGPGWRCGGHHGGSGGGPAVASCHAALCWQGCSHRLLVLWSRRGPYHVPPCAYSWLYGHLPSEISDLLFTSTSIKNLRVHGEVISSESNFKRVAIPKEWLFLTLSDFQSDSL